MVPFNIKPANFIQIAQNPAIEIVYFSYQNDYYFFCKYNDFLVFTCYCGTQDKDLIVSAFNGRSTLIFEE